MPAQNNAPNPVQMPSIPGVGVFAPQKGNCDFFIYPAYAATVTHAAAAVPVNVQISADSDFYWTASTFLADISAAAFLQNTMPLPLITVQITDNGSNRNLFNQAVPLPAIAGTGQLPYRLVHPRLFTRSTTFTVTFQNYDAAVNYTNVYLLMHGFKVYTLG
jgi:hypothetical protein